MYKIALPEFKQRTTKPLQDFYGNSKMELQNYDTERNQVSKILSVNYYVEYCGFQVFREVMPDNKI